MSAALVLALVLTTSALAVPNSNRAASNLTGIEFQKVENHLEVVIKVDGEFNYDTFELTSPKRVVIDISPIGQISAAPALSINESGVIACRTARFKADTARVVFDLAEKSPSHRISKIDAGLKIMFWIEEAGRIPAEIRAEVEAAKKAEPQPVREQPRTETRQPAERSFSESAFGPEKEFFLQLRGGVGLFPKPNNESLKDFVYFGETATLKENYKLKMTLAFDANFGKYFTPKLKAGVGASLWAFQYDGVYDFSLPHPFIENSPRNAIFTENLKDTIFNFYAFALFKVMETEKLRLWLGPAIGFATGKFSTMGDFEIEDKSPFSSADISLTSTTPVEDSVSGFTFSGLVNLEYILSPRLSLVLNADGHYFNPTLQNTGKRLNFIVTQLTLGLQMNF